MENYTPVIGKTYTLFDNSNSTEGYYTLIRNLTNDILDRFSLTERDLLIYLQATSRNRRLLAKELRQNSQKSKLGFILHFLHDALTTYVPGVEKHLRSEPFYKFITDKTILTNRAQYYMYMIEIELMNRLNKNRFATSNFRIALLPYCLKKTQTDCKSVSDEIEYYCKGCLKTCYINKVSTLLRQYNIHPYIWRTIRLRSLLCKLVKKYDSVGVMGIACIVELTMGMRSCLKSGFPAVGLPLNANRCIRWMGDFYENSVDLEELKSLVTLK